MIPSLYPCPICHKMMCVIGKSSDGSKITSCGCQFKFKKTKFQKELDRKYIKTEYGLERIK